MWPSQQLATRISDWANFSMILSLAIGVISTVLIVWMSNIKESFWDEDRRESRERIAELTAQGEQLREDTAEATERAEAEMIARIKLEAKLAPRRLSGEDTDKMVAILSKIPPVPVAIVSRLLDSEGKDFAN